MGICSANEFYLYNVLPDIDLDQLDSLATQTRRYDRFLDNQAIIKWIDRNPPFNVVLRLVTIWPREIHTVLECYAKRNDFSAVKTLWEAVKPEMNPALREFVFTSALYQSAVSKCALLFDYLYPRQNPFFVHKDQIIIDRYKFEREMHLGQEAGTLNPFLTRYILTLAAEKDDTALVKYALEWVKVHPTRFILYQSIRHLSVFWVRKAVEAGVNLHRIYLTSGLNAVEYADFLQKPEMVTYLRGAMRQSKSPVLEVTRPTLSRFTKTAKRGIAKRGMAKP